MRCLLGRPGEPQFFTDLKGKGKIRNYDDLDASAEGRDARATLRAHLVDAQQGLCAYCCRSIEADGDASLVEHLKPRSLFPRDSLNYDNMVASCAVPDTCGEAKGKKYDERLFLSPLAPGCDLQFKFRPNGEVVGVTDRARYMIDLLNLNSYSLRSGRQATFRAIGCYPDCNDAARRFYLSPQKDGTVKPFADAVEFYLEHDAWR